MNNELIRNFTAISERITALDNQLSNVMDMLNNERKAEIEAITPYTQTKTAYIGDTEITFYTDVTGNLTVYFPYEYTVERLTDRIIITFEPLEEVTDITISIL